jgi:hypothetical protein
LRKRQPLLNFASLDRKKRMNLRGCLALLKSSLYYLLLCINKEGMSEVGLVPFARVALEVSREGVAAYSHRFSPQRFTQPQLLAILCLKRYEDWTFRAGEVRLAEHRELRQALELQAVPDYSTLFRFMLRVEEQVIAQVLAEVVRRFHKSRPASDGSKKHRGGGCYGTGSWSHQHVFHSSA